MFLSFVALPRRARSWSRGSSWSRARSRMALAAIGLLLAGCAAQADEVGAAMAYRIARPYQRAYRDLLGYAERCQSKVAFAIDPDLGQAEVEVFLRTLVPFHRWRFEFSRVTATTSVLVTRTVWASHDSATRSFVAAAQGQIPPCPFHY
jgi:hypothetical protein